MAFEIIPSKSIPKKQPPIVPLPPDIAIPPITADATALSVYESPITALAEPNLISKAIAARETINPEIVYISIFESTILIPDRNEASSLLPIA